MKQQIGNSPIGEKFYHGIKVLQVIRGGCSECYFNRNFNCLAIAENYDPACISIERIDKKSIAFRLVGYIGQDGKMKRFKSLPNP